jgi:uncharacterized protein
MFRLLSSLLLGLLTMSGSLAATDDALINDVQAWRAARVARLSKPDGWLSLVGLHWLKVGDNRIGSAKGNDIVLDKAPAKLGIATLSDGKVTLTLARSAADGVSIDGKHLDTTVMVPDSAGEPTSITFESVKFYLIQRGDRFGLRVKDSEAETRTKFLGIDYFDIAPEWVVHARWEPYDPPREIEIPTMIGTIEKYPVPGVAVFERDGKTYRLTPYLEEPGDKQLFLVFADRTSGKETYGAGRFLYMDMPQDGKLMIDFNRAYNPPCVFTPFATCPLAPPENRLSVAVTAGEKKYRGAQH